MAGMDLVRLGAISSTQRQFLAGAPGVIGGSGGGFVDTPNVPGYVPYEDIYSGLNYELICEIDTAYADATIRFGNNDSIYKEFAQSFVGDGAIIYGVKFLADFTIWGGADIIAYLYAHSGTFGSTGVPTGSALATATLYDISYINIENNIGYLAFYFSTPYETTADTKYFVSIKYTNDVVGGFLRIYVDSSDAPNLIGNIAYKGATTWTSLSTFELCYGLYGKYRSLLMSCDNVTFGDQYNHLSTSENRAISQCFLSDGTAVQRVIVEMKKTGSPTGSMYARVYAMTGTYGTNGRPTGTMIAESVAFNVSTLVAGSSSLQTLSFTGANLVALTAGSYYCVALEYTGGNSSNMVDVVVNIGNGGSAEPGNAMYYNGTTWATTTYGSVGTSGTSDDLCGFFYGI